MRMRDARYLRSQAEFCLEMARNINDRKIADHLRQEAEQYMHEADQADEAQNAEAEVAQKAAAPPPSA